jgi:hypothetical protein
LYGLDIQVGIPLSATEVTEPGQARTSFLEPSSTILKNSAQEEHTPAFSVTLYGTSSPVEVFVGHGFFHAGFASSSWFYANRPKNRQQSTKMMLLRKKTRKMRYSDQLAYF